MEKKKKLSLHTFLIIKNIFQRLLLGGLPYILFSRTGSRDLPKSILPDANRFAMID